MNVARIAAFSTALLVAGAIAQAPNPTRVRGTISAVDGNVVTVKSRDGQDIKLALAPNVTFAYMKKVELADITPGTPLGTTAVRGSDGKLVARELHVFNRDRPIPGEGHRPWDNEPEATMTNATVTAMVQGNDGRELTLTYQGGEQKVVVPAGIPIVMAVESDRSVLVIGEYAFIAVTTGADGSLTATRFQVAKGGVRPPQ
jgi:hypothetical protein